MLITFRAKVKLISEEKLEIDNSSMNIKFDGRWVWRKVAIPYSDIFRVVQYSNNKTLVYLYGYDEQPETLLVSEDYETVFKKWDELRQAYGGEVPSYQEDLDPDSSEDSDEEDSDSDGDILKDK